MICRSCNKEARQVTTKFEINGKPLPEPKDECENCKDGGLHNDPAWMRSRPVPLYESRPHLYKKKDDPEGGAYYEPTDESRADLEAQVSKVSDDDLAAIEGRRKRARSLSGEINLAKADQLAREFVQHYSETWKEYEEANAEYWNTAAEDLKVQ